ncbi:hypothetical protein ACFVS2_26165 [Brevibacillus sp. NPDC058079]|uniref:hypothetical protein n=1 Tax=Brevibacillus sp. NPDC058079 TaxID=3346330 RepID=UPI0036E44A21
MGMNVTGHVCTKGKFWVDYNLDHVSWWADDLWLELLKTYGTILSQEEQVEIEVVRDDDVLQCLVDIVFNQTQLHQIEEDIQNVVNSFATSKPDYSYKYSNETDMECISRWTSILRSLHMFDAKIDWKNEYLAIYTSY